MRLKRHYQRSGTFTEDGHPVLVLDEKTQLPILTHVEVQHTGSSLGQNFSASLVAAGLGEGWMSINEGVLTLKTAQADLAYKILRVPGKYALKSGGYEVIHCYECVLDAKQHATFCAQTEADRREAAFLLSGIVPKRKSHMKEVARG